MGFSAAVACNCWKEGKTTAPPVAVELIRLDECGHLSLQLPWDEHRELHKLFREWKEVCCEHENMDFAWERICNVTGRVVFLQALERAGSHHFPVLYGEFPVTNDGELAPPLAKKGLGEIEYFRYYAELGSIPCLVDSETGESIYESRHPRYSNGNSGTETGINEQGFFIRDEKSHNELFRAMRMQVINMSGDGKGKLVRDLDSRNEIWCDVPGPVRDTTSEWMHVELRKVDADYFANVIDALESVFQASIETGNPVCWG